MTKKPLKIKMSFKKANQIREGLIKKSTTTSEISLQKKRIQETIQIKSTSLTSDEFKTRMADVKAQRRKENYAILKEKIAAENPEQRQARLDKQKQYYMERKQKLQSQQTRKRNDSVLKSIENLNENNNCVLETREKFKLEKDFLIDTGSINTSNVINSLGPIARGYCNQLRLFNLESENFENKITCSQREF